MYIYTYIHDPRRSGHLPLPGCQGEDRTPRRERFLRNLSHKGSQQPGV